MLIDRIDELARLRGAAASATPQLVILRGRRRVGKSHLLDEAFGSGRVIFFQADEQHEQAHLELFAREAATMLPGAPPLTFDGWDSALGFVGSQAEQEPLVVVLDEFQWLLEAQPALDSIIQRHWDGWQRRRVPIVLVLSGSALSLMESLLAPDRPLFGRADYRPLLDGLDYRWAAEFAYPGAPAEELLRRFATLGGTPQYQVWAGRGPLREVIADRILAKGEPLYEEPLHLLREERSIRAPGSYFKVLQVIANGASTNNEIANQATCDTPTLAKMLARLGELGYVELRRPLGPAGHVEKRGVYRIRDPFYRFWFRYVLPNRSRLERGRVGETLAMIERDEDNFMDLVFEDCCREWVGRYADRAALENVDEIGAWWDRRVLTEIDVVGVRRRRYSLLGSCKWDVQAPAQALGSLRKDQETLGPAGQDAQLVIFARGFANDLRLRAEREGVILVAADGLFPPA